MESKDANQGPGADNDGQSQSPGSETGRDGPPQGERFRAARAGSRAVLGALLEECRNYLLLIANRELGDGIQAKVGASDLVQETFFEAQKIFDRFKGNSREELRLWLARILEFKIAQATRRYAGTEMRDVRREVPLDTMSQDLRPELSIESDSTRAPPEERDRKLVALRTAIERLPPAYRLAIEMRSFEKRPFAELAVKLERSTDAARRLWLRAVVRLRSELTGASTRGESHGSNHEQGPFDS
jgi:RNA polymerase sigma-70 factor, ECF subfamily